MAIQPRVIGLVDHAHAANADFIENAMGADLFVYLAADEIVDLGTEGGRPFREFGGVDLQQLADFAKQGVVTCAFMLEKLDALPIWQQQSGVKQDLESVPARLFHFHPYSWNGIYTVVRMCDGIQNRRVEEQINTII